MIFNIKLIGSLQAALGNPDVQEVLFDATLKYVLVILASGSSQAQLTAIQPDYVQLKAAWPSKLASGLIVTCAGRKDCARLASMTVTTVYVAYMSRIMHAVRPTSALRLVHNVLIVIPSSA